MIELTKRQQDVLAIDGHGLVKGGPGSGKTTVSILKAGTVVREQLSPGQRVLFLSFARATVSRVLEAMDEESGLHRDVKRLIEVDTYHAFFWRLIKTHGYLLGLPRRLKILTPHNEAVALSQIRNGYRAQGKLSAAERDEKINREEAERLRLAMEEAQVCFDLFADLVGQLLHGSNKIKKLIANAYPTIILDEFQDTAADQWHVIQALGGASDLLALADPEQRIFDFIGADPERLNHFIQEFDVVPIDLSDENHRSKGTDIVHFGNDILKGRYSKDRYEGIDCVLFESNTNQAISKVVTETLQARKRLIDSGPKDWSLAILVPTKRMTRLVSDVFREPLGGLPKIQHYAVVDMEAAILAAEVIAYGLQSHGGTFNPAEFVALVASYFRGKGGDSPSRTSLQEASRIFAAHDVAVSRRAEGKDVPNRSVFLPIERAIHGCLTLALTGDPGADWLTIRRHFADAGCKRLAEIASEVRNIRLLERGTQLREALSQNWRDTGRYTEALEIVRQAFIRDHFATNTKPESGVVVMNMHKAKGKQFDEVIVFEGWPKRAKGKIVANPDRIVRGNMRENIDDQARQNFRVSVTRAKRRTTILTPRADPCALLVPET
ncbi:MAG: ATP-dependent helicase [Gammaproteobacteria bacterium]|nr:ATP-dependent helicase [Gammaproteobacteria bacterium]